MSCLDENLVLELVEGSLDDARRAAIQAHLDTCERCQELVAALAGVAEVDARDAPDPEATQIEPGSAATPTDDPAWSGIRPELRQRYVLDELLGAGAMGVVHVGRDQVLDRKVAIKLIRPHLARDARLIARMEREARAIARLNHSNVVQVYDFVHQRDTGAFIVMELIEGLELRAWLARSERSWREIVEVFVAAGRGLAAAHAAGILHRDFKPDNVMVGDDGKVRVMDFGLARIGQAGEPAPLEHHAADREELGSSVELDPRLTQPGTIMGTPLYMAPEQYRGIGVDARTDQFAFCVALFEALCGRGPFAASGYRELRAAVLEDRREQIPDSVDLPPRVTAILDRGLATDPAQRFPSMDALVAELEASLATRRAPWLVASLAVVASLGIGVSAWALTHRDDPQASACTGAEARVSELWSPEVAERLAAGFAATELGYADPTWARVERVIDAWTRDWIAMRTEACEATQLRREQSVELMDLRMRCLDERLAELRELLVVLDTPDPVVVEHALEAAGRLGSLATCADQRALTARMPPPTDPELAAAVGRLRARLTEAAVLHNAGKHDEAIAAATEVLADPAASDYTPVHAEALLTRARPRLDAADLDRAEADCEAAINEALAAGHDEVLAEALIVHARLLGHDRADPVRGLELIERARAAVARLDDPPRLLARWHQARGMIATVAGEWDQALEHHRACLALIDELDPEPLDLRAATLNAIGDNLRRAGRPGEALELFEQALALRREQLGPEHPGVANDLNNLAIALGDLGRVHEAVELYRESLAILERAHGPAHPDVGRLHNNLGMSALSMGQPEQAVEHLERALAIKQGIYGEDHPALGSTLGNLSNALRATGRLDEAEAAIVRARGLFATKLGEQHWAVAQADALIGRLALARGDLDEALRLTTQALATTEAAVDADNPLIASRLCDVGEVELARARANDIQAALDHFERARAIVEGVGEPNPVELARALVGRGRARLELGDSASAIQDLRRAIASLASLDERDDVLLAEARFALARALWPDARDEARALLDAAAPGFESPGVPEVRRQAFLEWASKP